MPLVVIAAAERYERLARAQQCQAAAGQDTFLDRRAGRMQRILDTALLLFHPGFGGRADLDQRDTAGELGGALLQLFLVVIADVIFGLLADFLDAIVDSVGLSAAADKGGVFFRGFNAFCRAQVGDAGFLQRQTERFGDDRAAGNYRNIFQHRLAAVAKTGCLDGAALENAAQMVDHLSPRLHRRHPPR